MAMCAPLGDVVRKQGIEGQMVYLSKDNLTELPFGIVGDRDPDIRLCDLENMNVSLDF